MRPAQERLDARHRAVQQRELRLVVQHELAGGDRSPEVLEQPEPIGLGVERPVVELDRRPVLLRPVHRLVGVLHQVCGGHGVERCDGDADAGLDPHRHRVEHERLADLRRDPLCHLRGVPRIGVDQENGELVAADPRDEIRVAEAAHDARAELDQQLVAGGVTERVVHLLEPVEVDEQKREPALDVVLAEEVLERLAEPPAVAEPGERVGQRLASPLVHQAAKGLRRQTEPDRGQSDRDGRECHRDAVDRAGRPDDQDPDRSDCARAGEGEAGCRLVLQQIGLRGRECDRERDEPDRGRPRDPVGDGREVRRAGGREQVERVAEGVHGAPGGDEAPRRLPPPGEEDRAADRHREQEDVADRIREVRRHLGGASADDRAQVVEREGTAERRCPDSRDHAVEPRGRHRAPQRPPDHQPESEVGDRKGEEIEEVGDRRHRRLGAAEGLDRPRHVAERPEQHRASERERDRSPGTAGEGDADPEGAHEELERVDAPAVEQRRALVGRAHDEDDEVRDEEDPEDCESGACRSGHAAGHAPLSANCGVFFSNTA